MKILLIIASNEGTIARVSHNLYKALLKTGADVSVICFSKQEEGFNFGNILVSQKTHKTLGFILNKIERIRFISNVKKTIKPDLTISTQSGCNALNALSYQCGKMVGIEHGKLWQAKVGLKKEYPFILLSYKFLYKRFSKIIGISREVVKDVQDNSNCRKAELAYNIHDIENIKSLAKEELFQTEQHIFNKKVLLYVGHLYTKVKAPQRLVEAYYKMSEEDRKQTNVVFIGQSYDGAQEMLQERCKELGLNNVHFLGEKRNPYQYISRCEMLISTSINEGLPGVHIEALILGKKVVSTNSSTGVWDIMECYDEYQADLRENYSTNYGVITPNLVDDEESTSSCISEGISYVLHNKFSALYKFDSDRFRDMNVVEHYLSL